MSRLHVGSLLTLCLTLGPAWSAEELPHRTDAFGDPLPDGAVARLGTVRWPSHYVISLMFSRDGKVLAAGNADGVVQLLNPTDGREIRRFQHDGGRTQVALSPDGKTLASFTGDGVLLWEIATGKLLAQAKEGLGWTDGDHPGVLFFSPDGKRVMVGHGEDMRFFDASSGDAIPAPAPPEKGLAINALAEDGTTAVSAGPDGALVVWDLTTRKVLGRVSGCGGPGAIALSPDHRRLAASWGYEDPPIQIWDLETGKKLSCCKGHHSAICSLCFSPDGKLLASSARDLTSRLWDAETGKERWQARTRPTTDSFVPVCFAPDGKVVAVVGWDGAVRLIDADSGKERGDPNELRDGVAAVAFTADGKRIVTGAGDHSVRLWDAATGKETRRLKGPSAYTFAAATRAVVDPPDWVCSVAASPDDKAIAAGTGAGVLLWDNEGADKPWSLQGTTGCPTAAFSPDGCRLATWDKRLRLWERGSGKELPTENNVPLGVCPLCFSPDGRVLALGCYDGSVHFWNLADGREIAKIKAHDETCGVYSLSYSPDGKTLASTGNDSTVRVWEVVSSKERESFAGQRERDYAAYSPDGRYLAFGGTDNHAIHIYDLAAGKEVHEFRGHDGWISCLAFSPDGKRLVSGGEDSTALVWDMTAVRPADLPKEADLSAKERDALWDRLAGDDVADAGRAIRSLLAAPRQAAALLRERLRPDSTPQADQIARLIRDLDADDFDVREQASARLRALGQAAAPALRQTLDGNPSAEVRQRGQSLLAALDKGGPPPEVLRASRAVEVLERLGTPEADEILKRLAGGNEKAALTQDAAAALARLKNRRDGSSVIP